MLIQELKEGIMNNSLFEKYGNKLIFIGEESFLENLYLRQLARKTNSKLIFADDFLDIKKKLTSNTAFDKSGIFVIRNSTQFLKNEDLFENVNVPKGKYLILIFDKFDKRKAFFKENENITCEFEKMTTAQLTNIIQKRIALNELDCKYLCELIDNDYGRLLLELDKLSIYFKLDKYSNISNVEKFNLALKDSLIYQEINDVSFDLTYSIIEKNIVNSLGYLQELKRSDNDAFKILGLIYSSYKNLLLLKCNPNVNINRYTKNNLSKYLNKYNAQEIINQLSIIQEVEQGIKSGKVESDMALDVLIIRLLFN